MRIRLAFLLGLLLLALAGLGGAAAARSAVVVISDDFDPAVLRVPIGTAVTWRNADDQRHRVRSREGPLEFDSGDIEPGESFSFRFEVEGRYGYRDSRGEEDEGRDEPDEKGGASGTILVDPPAAEGAPSPDASAASAPAPVRPATDAVATSPVPTMAPSAAPTASPASPSGSPSSEASTPATVGIADRAFEPPEVTVAVGETVRWTNSDGEGHTVTAVDGSFDSGLMAGGMSFETTFEVPGTFDYSCAIHPEMRGRIIVTPRLEVSPGADGTAGATASPTSEPQGPAPSDGTDVAIAKSRYEPARLEVPAGVTVTWTNDDPVAHTVTARDGAFSSGIIRAGEEFSVTFGAPGTYDYFCAIHPGQAGTIVVSDPGS